MNKLGYSLDIIYLILSLFLILITVIPSCFIPVLPVYYLIYIFFYLLLILFYTFMLTKSVICYYIFLIVAGGIIVTFLFYIIIPGNINVFIYIYIIFFILILFFFVIMTMTSSFQEDNFIKVRLEGNCYVNDFSLFLTLTCILLLLYIIYVVVKVSTYLKTSPIRKINKK